MIDDTGHTLLGERLNAEPAVFRGCTASELVTLVIVAAAIWLPFGLIGGLFVGELAIGMACGVVALVGTLFVVPTVFQIIKRGRPDGYYQIRLRIWAARGGVPFVQCDYLLRDGMWDTGRG